MSPTQRGFTLPELLITLTLVAILAGLAGPTFSALRDEWLLREATRTVLSALAQTRLAAVDSGRPATLCPSDDGETCAAGAAHGFLVRLESGAAPPVLARSSFDRPLVLSANRPAATYYALPRAASPVTLVLCALPRRAASRLIVVSQQGRPRVERARAC